MNKLSKCSMDRTRNTERRQLVFSTSSRRDESFLWFSDVKLIRPIVLHATKKSPKDFGVCFIWPFPNFRFNMWSTFQSFSHLHHQVLISVFTFDRLEFSLLSGLQILEQILQYRNLPNIILLLKFCQVKVSRL